MTRPHSFGVAKNRVAAVNRLVGGRVNTGIDSGIALSQPTLNRSIPMKIRHFAVVVAVSSALASPLAMAESVRAGKLSARHSFTTDVTRTTGSGKTLSRHTAQVATDTGFRRETSVTNPQGNTASRSVEASIDKANNTLTKNVSATGFNGETHTATVVKPWGDGSTE